MSVAYLDTSAAMKLIAAEAESDALKAELDSDPGRVLTSSWLLHTELHCALGRRSAEHVPDAVAAVLDYVELSDLEREDLIAAGEIAPLRSNDAIHLSVALRVKADEFITYDKELAAAARDVGLAVVSPS